MTLRGAGPIFVEFIGLPGAGKSTLSHKVARNLVQTGLSVNEATYKIDHGLTPGFRRLRKFGFVLLALVTSPSSSLALLREVGRLGQNTVGDTIKIVFNALYLGGIYQYLRGQPGIHFFDQGILQAFWSIGYSAKKNLDVRYVGELVENILPLRTIVVYVNVSSETAIDRLKCRGSATSRLEKFLEAGEWIFWKWSHSRLCLDIVLKVASHLHQKKTLLNTYFIKNNDKTVEEIVTEVSKLLLTDLTERND